MLSTFAFICFGLFYGCHCGIPPRNYDLQFPEQKIETDGINDFVHILGMPKLTEFTICFLMQASNGNSFSGTPFSYAVSETINELLIHDYNDLKLFIGGEVRDTNINVNDGQKHHICATWDNTNGDWQFFKDGQLTTEASGFQQGHTIVPGGSLVLGQRQLNTVWPNLNFEEKSQFVGTLTNVNMWSYVLPQGYIANLAKYCYLVDGDIYAWSDFIYGVRGNTGITSPSSCQPSGRPAGGSFRQ